MPKQETTMTNGQTLFDLAQQLETQRWQLLLDADVQALAVRHQADITTVADWAAAR